MSFLSLVGITFVTFLYLPLCVNTKSLISISFACFPPFIVFIQESSDTQETGRPLLFPKFVQTGVDNE